MERAGQTRYTVIVKTGDQKYSGTDCNIKLKIVGSKGETKFKTLDYLCYDDFERGQTDQYTIYDVDVGKIECISIKVSQSTLYTLYPNWYIDYILVCSKYNSKEGYRNFETVSNTLACFPIYQWITELDHKRELCISTNKTQRITRNQLVPSYR